MTKFHLIKRKLFFSWLVSYLVILLIAAFVSSIVYYRVVGEIDNELKRGNSFFLGKIQKSGDSRLNDIRYVSMVVAMDSRIASLASVRGPFTAQHQETIMRARDFLSVVRSSNSFIDQIYVYFKNTDTVVGSSSHVDSEMAYNLYHLGGQLTYDEWKNIVNRKYGNEFIGNLITRQGETAYNTVTYILSAPIEDMKNFTANVVLQVRQDKFNGMLDSFTNADGHVIAIMNKDTLFAVSKSIDAKMPQKYMEVGEVPVEVKDSINGGKSMVVSSIASEINGFNYISIVPYKEYMKRVTNAISWMILGIVIFLITGAAVSHYLVKKNYKPIHGIITSIAQKVGLSLDSGSNELNFIQNVLDKTMNENFNIQRDFKKHKNVLRSNFFERLLKGREYKRSISEEILESFNIEFQTMDFSVLLFLIGNFEEGWEADEVKHEEIMLVQFIITNIFEELINQKDQGYMVELDNSTMACIVNFRDAEEETSIKLSRLAEIVGNAHQFIMERFDINFTISISSVQASLGGIAFAYREALEAMEYRLIAGKNRIIRYSDIEKTERVYDYSIETEYRLVNLLKEGDFERARSILDKVFEKNFEVLSLSVETGECLVFHLLSSIIKTVGDNLLLDDLKAISRMKKCSTILQMKNEMTLILKEVCDYFTEKNRIINESKLGAEITAFIEKNYRNQNLSVMMIGESFSITPNYISRLFKIQTGEGLHSHIEKIRVKKARELLKNESVSINDIAREVGFTNVKTFIRSFKKIEGTTPGRYKGIA